MILSEQALDLARRTVWPADRVEVALRQLAMLGLDADDAELIVLEASAGRLDLLPLDPAVLKAYVRSVRARDVA